jgi:hypothetical protein
MFTVPALTNLLTQGDLLDDCPLVSLSADLVLVAPVRDVQRLVEQGVLKGHVVRDHVRRHLVFGWYFMPAVTDPLSLPESLIDLRDVHSVPRAVLEHLIVGGKRVASLVSPYREHLAQHFAVTYMRVALPEPYTTRA